MIAMVQKQSGDIGASLATILFVWTILKDHFPFILNNYIKKHFHKLVRFVSPYIDITFHEHGETFSQNEAFSAIKSYLSTKASSWASSFKADFIKQSKSLILSVDDHEEVTDEFRGVKVWWVLENKQQHLKTQEKRYFKLSFLRRHKEFIEESYIDHVIKEGKALALKNRQRKMYSNNPCIDGNNWRRWSFVYFDHPATFDTLAMESKKKEEIMNDLKKFSEAKEYYAKIGKAWKRGYLLYGPPGTGKSTMIAAMANFLNYDVYDLELTIVKNNRELRSLLITTSSKSLIVIEDVDCSLNLTGQRQSKSDSESKSSEVTLSGLLNFIDGLCSASGAERIVVFTTNHVDKLDPALIRRGRMDKHIEMSYCCFEAFKVLAKNYLDIDSHELFAEIDSLLAETNMTPADVAENIIPKSREEEDNIADSCLKNLIKALKEMKPVKGEEEERV
ncbi:hypothetical protein LWI29_029522 [Acer saccharum]|uniref:AAA+ ATPase domain-containing protein n=1 Tax=Acer saccharum TaxID=4024 RepID=A0AA39VTV1_ACESA|nr:hypothetical protein LWI29_029522 [Acer saccharum]KAK1566609.1 hypothetical protein Q3G72_001940 [Acer saccharum]